MSRSTYAAGTIRIGLSRFPADEAEAFRRLLEVLGKHLHHPWTLCEAGSAVDILFVNLDEPDDGTPPGRARTVGCARKPRQHPAGTLHRPPRVYEILSAVNAVTPSDAPRPPQAASDGLRFRLTAWPTQFASWPKSWWSVLACIRGTACDRATIAARTGVAADEVQRCLDELNHLGLLAMEHAAPQDRLQPAAPAPGRWRSLAGRVSQLLGFGR